jgi:hypothetical protein
MTSSSISAGGAIQSKLFNPFSFASLCELNRATELFASYLN